MSAILESVEAFNFRSWKHLKFRFDKKDSVIVYGDTGTGKSSIFSAPYWALYGELPEAASADEVIREGSEPYGNTAVSLRWHNETNDYFKLIRYRKHKEWKNKVVLWKNKIRLGAKDSKVEVINKIIEEQIGLDKEAFLNIIFFIQRDIQRFPALTDTNQKKRIESLTELYVLPTAEIITKARIQKVTQSIDLGKERVEQQILANKKIKKLIENSKEIAEQKRTKTKQELKSLQEKLDEAKANLKAFHKENEEAQDNINKLEAIVVDCNSEIEAIKEQIESLEQKIKKIASYPAGTMCDRCGSSITTEGCAQLSANITNEIEGYKTKLPDLEKKVRDVLAERKLISLKKLKKGMRRAEVRVTQIKSYIELTRRELKHTKDIKEDKIVKDTEAEVMKTKKYLKIFKATRRHLSFLESTFGRKGLRAKMLPEILLSLASRTNKFLQIFDNGVEVVYTLEEGKIIQRYRLQNKKRLRSYATLSGGEKQMVDVSTSLALREIAELGRESLFDCVILDEPLEGLDDKLIQKVPQLLEALGKRTVFVISHSEHLKPYFKTQVEVIARKGVSQLV